MTRTHAMAVLLLAAAGVTAAQTPAAPEATPPPAAEAAAAAPDAPAAESQPQGFTYTAEGRRDPFVTLVRRGTDTSLATATARAAGLAGLGAGEVSLRGTMASQGGYVAMLLGSDDRTYIVRPGDRLADGTIRTIAADELVILQQVRDPLGLQTQREVRKMLRTLEGTN